MRCYIQYLAPVPRWGSLNRQSEIYIVFEEIKQGKVSPGFEYFRRGGDLKAFFNTARWFHRGNKTGCIYSPVSNCKEGVVGVGGGG